MIGMKHTLKRGLLLIIGWLSLAIGIVGLVVPLLPTTPLLLISAWCFSRSSQRLHGWLINNRHVGHLLRRWEEEGTIERHIKRRAILTVLLGFTLTLAVAPLELPFVIALILLALMIMLIIYRLPESQGVAVEEGP